MRGEPGLEEARPLLLLLQRHGHRGLPHSVAPLRPGEGQAGVHLQPHGAGLRQHHGGWVGGGRDAALTSQFSHFIPRGFFIAVLSLYLIVKTFVVSQFISFNLSTLFLLTSPACELQKCVIVEIVEKNLVRGYMKIKLNSM